MRFPARLGFTALVGLALLHCGSSDPTENASGSSDQAMSTTVHSVYGMTIFGGNGDRQSLACTHQNSRTNQPYFVASSQRYGCGAHLKIEAQGRCVVARTDDAGPATFVETRAGTPVLDASPTVAAYLFGQRTANEGLGYSDLKHHPGKYDVHVTTTSLPLGPCPAAGGPGVPDVGAPPGPVPSSSVEKACQRDGDCNPGSTGSGKICESGTCVSGCRDDRQCPGATSCANGACR